MSIEEHREKSPKSINALVVTISDTRTKETDESGKLTKDLLLKNGHKVLDYIIMENDLNSIKSFLENEINWYRAHVIIINGGTGISTNDITVDIVEELLDKKLDGFGELFRYLSYQEIGSPALMSRSIAGLAGSSLIICLPGSPKAVRLAMEKLILPEITHMVMEISK